MAKPPSRVNFLQGTDPFDTNAGSLLLYTYNVYNTIYVYNTVLHTYNMFTIQHVVLRVCALARVRARRASVAEASARAGSVVVYTIRLQCL